ncbi:MAG: cob(I)yrinic acid a,c-diamide adenosyltransferase [Candidatus Paceibacterota bacterium]|jgi:cob(I)alamin adenosyltransferase
MLYTGKGDKGQTKLYHCDQRLSKSSLVAEALGSLDEINSFLGWCKVKAGERSGIGEILEEAQNHLFSIQAELAGAPKKLPRTAVTKVETVIKAIEKELSPIKSFIVSGGTELSVMLDVARTMARRAERQVVAVAESKAVKLSPATLAFLNRLSSLLYALARLANHRAGIGEKKPSYQ